MILIEISGAAVIKDMKPTYIPGEGIGYTKPNMNHEYKFFTAIYEEGSGYWPFVSKKELKDMVIPVAVEVNGIECPIKNLVEIIQEKEKTELPNNIHITFTAKGDANGDSK